MRVWQNDSHDQLVVDIQNELLSERLQIDKLEQAMNKWRNFQAILAR